MPEQQNVTNIPSNRVEFIDSRTGLVSREWYRFFLNLFTLAGGGGNQITLDDLQVGPPPQPVTEGGGGGGSGTVTSVQVSGGTTGLTTSGGPITSSGTITMGGTLNVVNGGTGATDAATARTNLSAAQSGANADITSMTGVTGGISTPDYIDFDTTAAPARATGRLWWDNADGIQTLNLGMAGTNATMQVGQESYYRIKASSAITEGQVVMFTGTVGASGALQGAPATGLTAATAQYVMGVATENIAHNGWGYVTEFGLVRGIDTSGGAEAWVDGQILYYDPTVAGGLTKTLPSAPNAKVVVAAVVYASASNGSLFIRPSFGGELGQYEGNVGFTSLSNGDLMQYDSGAGKWTNVPSSTFGTGSVTSVDTAGTVNGLTLTGGPITTSGTITLGGTLDLSSPPAIGSTTPAAGTFTTLTATGQTSLGGAAGAEGFRVIPFAGSTRWVQATGGSAGTGGVYLSASAGDLYVSSGAARAIRFFSAQSGEATTEQLRVAHTASAVNYVQVTGAATGSGNYTTISSQGSDAAVNLRLSVKGTGTLDAQVNSTTRWKINSDGSVDSGISASGGVSFKASATASQVNYLQSAGGVASSSPILSAQGTDTNISQVFQSKGTGAIDLAAGSRGVNISNGGTVTAITRTASGSGYTSFPTWTASAPTTAGGSTASGTPASMTASGYTVASGGTGYTVGDVLTVTGGTGGNCTLTVTAVSAGAVTTATLATTLSYTALPTNPVSVTGGTGTGATFNLTYGIGATFTITNAGSGYVEQPTVSFSGGGGSGAAAYATVGSGTVVKSIGSTMDFYTPNAAIGFRVEDSGSTGTAYWRARAGGGSAQLLASAAAAISSTGTGNVSFYTNGISQEQLRVSHTASAVNYVQVTGAATGSPPVISTQGSDANRGLNFWTKGTGTYNFYSASGTYQHFQIFGGNNAVNFLQVAGTSAGVAPLLSAQGTDTNIDLALTPKGTGVVRTSGTGIRLYGSSSGYVGLKGAAAAGSTTYTLPAADGTSGQVLSTDGAATLSWATPSGSSNITAQGMWENALTISSNYTITSGNSAMSAGPITVASGVTVTVPSGSRWVVV